MNKVIIFTADFCVHCRAFHKVVDKSRYRDRVEFVDAEESDLVDKFHVRNLPLVVVVDGDMNEVARIGECSLDAFDEFVGKFME